MLFGKVTDFNVRGNLRAPTAPSRNQNPFYLSGFESLDHLVCDEFLDKLPHFYKTFDPLEGSPFDTDLYMVHIIPHAYVFPGRPDNTPAKQHHHRAAITLHNPYIDFSDPQCRSTLRCMESARAILTAYYKLSSTSFDITRLHPFATVSTSIK